MKRVLFVVAILAAIGVAAFFYIRHLRMRSFAERLFPQDTIAFLDISDTRETASSFQNTDLGKAIAQSPRKDVYRRLGERMALSAETFVGADLRPLLDQLRGRVSAGIFPLPSGRRGLGIFAFAADQKELRKQLEQTLDPAWRRRDPDLKKEQVVEQGVTYYKYSSPRFPDVFQPCYTFLDHHLVITHNQVSMTRLLETRINKASTLGDQELYRRAVKSVDFKTGVFVYLNPAVARSSIEAEMPAQAKLIWPQVVQASGMDALEFVAWTSGIQDGHFQGRGFTGISKNRSGILKVVMERSPVRLQSTAAVPESAQFFYAATLPEFSRFNQEAGPNWSRIWLFVQALTGIDVRQQILEVLGDEFIIFSTTDPTAAAVEESLASAPKSALSVHLRSPERFAATLARLTELAKARGLEPGVEKYQGADVLGFRYQFGNLPLNPAYSVQGSWFSVSTDAALLKASLDARQQSGQIVKSAAYRKAIEGFPAELNGLSYTRISELLRSYAVMFRRQAEKEPWIREYGLDQEFDYLAGKLGDAASFVRFEKDGIRFESRSSVPAGFLALPLAVAQLPELLDRNAEDPTGFE